MFDGNGNWTSDFSAQADRDNGIKILASRFDNIFIADIKESFENCLTKDGQIAPIGDFNMGGQRILNLDDGINAKDAVNKSQLDTTIENLKQAFYPVGAVYANSSNTNPSTTLGFGTWINLGSTLVTTLLDKTPVYGEDNTCLQVRSTLANGTSPADYNLISSSYTHDGNIDGLVLGNSGLGRVNRAGKVNIVPKSADVSSNAYADTSTATKITVYLWQRTA